MLHILALLHVLLLIPRNNTKKDSLEFCAVLKIVTGQIQPCVNDVSSLHEYIEVENLVRIVH